MSNCRLKYATDIANKIKEYAGVNTTSAIKLKENQYLLPLGGFNGSNEKLQTLANTYQWAKKVQTWANERYNSKAVGNLVEVIPNDKGTIISITIPKRLIDAYENKFGQMTDEDFQAAEVAQEYYSSIQMFNLEGDKEERFNETLNDKLTSILTGLGVKVEFLDNLPQETATGLWDSFNQIVQVAKDKQSKETLPEEASHAIIDGMLNDPSVQSLLKQTKKLGYKQVLGEQTAEYEKLYNNDVDLLTKEAAGKLLSQAIINNFESPEQSNILNNICKFIWNKFKLLFKTISGETTKSIQDEVDEITNKLSKSVLSGELNRLDFSYDTKKAILYNVKPKLEKKDKYFKQVVELKRSIARNDKLLKTLDKTTDKYKVLEERTNLMRESLRDYEINKKEDSLKKTATYQLQLIKGLVDAYDNGFKPAVNDVRIAYETLTALRSVVGLEAFVIQETGDNNLDPKTLLESVDDIQREYADQIIINASNEEVKPTSEDIANQDTDINKFTMGFGTLTNVTNYIARTIGTLIKAAQIRISKKQGAIYKETKDHVDKLKQWGKDNGVKDIYSPFIQNNRGTTVLTRQWNEQFYTDLENSFKTGTGNWKLIATRNSDGTYTPINVKKYENPNYKIIQSNKVLKEFYDFYLKTMKDSMDRLPTHLLNGTGGQYKDGFIANIVRDDLQHLLSSPTIFGKAKQLFGNITNIRVKETKETDFINSEILQKDEIPVQFLKKITSEDKSNDLGEALYKFAAFTISHEELTEVLPQARLLENRLHAQGEFIKSSNPNQTVAAEDSNLATLVKKSIEMQLLGKTKEDQGKINIGKIYDDKGNEIGHKYVSASSIADFGLKYNSLLRIGFNPFNAITNVVIGEISTAMEAIGGRYFNKQDLTDATGIFFKEINADESKTKKFLEIFNPLQELEDYDYARNVSTKPNVGEKIKSYLYAPQKTGELFLQTRTMIAMLKHKTFKVNGEDISFWDLLDDHGQLKEEYSSLMTKDELDNLITSFSAKIQAVNSKMHGRYSQRDAAIINQNILWRMAFQFKKWIPAAIEVRLGSKQFDNTLGDIQEGRWKTFGKMLANFQDTYSRLKQGQLEEYEIYNFKKTATELVILMATIILYYGLKWDDDESRKNDAWYKFTMDQLDKVSGDLLFMSNPRNVTKLTKSPFAITKLADQIIDLGSAIPTLFGYDEMNYKRGPNKGKNKVAIGLIGLTPGLKPFNEVVKTFNDQKYQSYH